MARQRLRRMRGAAKLRELEKLVPLDPDHLPAAIRGIRFVAKKLPKLAQVACFDTAFHGSLPTVAKMYALPRRFYDEGIRRYGFHGLSFEYIVGELRKLDAKPLEGAELLTGAIEDIARGATGSVQSGAGSYQSWPTRRELRSLRTRGGALLRFADLVRLVRSRNLQHQRVEIDHGHM